MEDLSAVGVNKAYSETGVLGLKGNILNSLHTLILLHCQSLINAN